MVRYVHPPPEGIACGFKSSICQPKDNIGISCVFSAAGNNATRDKPSTGVRRKYTIPKDNLGIACLPTTESMRLRDIPEVSEYDSCEETYINTNVSLSRISDKNDTRKPEKQKLLSATTKITGRARCNVPKDNLSSSCRHINRGVAIAQIRSRAGENEKQIQSRSTKSGNRGSTIDQFTQLNRNENIDFFDESERSIPPSKKVQSKSTSLDIGISNIRRPKYNPTQPRKLIVPKDNIGFSGRHLQKSLITSGGLKPSAINSLKKISGESEKNASSQKSLSNLSENRTATQNKSLKASHIKPE